MAAAQPAWVQTFMETFFFFHLCRVFSHPVPRIPVYRLTALVLKTLSHFANEYMKDHTFELRRKI